jgi:hypothetical protein
MYIAEQHGEELTYNAENNKIYKVLDKSAGVFTLLPLDGSEPPTSHFSEASLIFRADIANRTAKIGKITDRNGITTGAEQHDNGTEMENTTGAKRLINGRETEPTTDAKRIINGIASEQQRLYIGAGKTNLPKISGLYSGELAVVLADIEAAMDKILFNTDKEATIRKTVGNYNDAKKYAAAGNLYELKLLLKNLQGRIAKQAAIGKGVEKMEHKAQLKKRVVNVLIIMVFAAATLFYFRPWQHRTTPASAPTLLASTIQKATTDPGTDGGELDRAIAAFERETGKKIYPAGRVCLQRAAAKHGLTTQQQLLNLIKSNVK